MIHIVMNTLNIYTYSLLIIVDVFIASALRSATVFFVLLIAIVSLGSLLGYYPYWLGVVMALLAILVLYEEHASRSAGVRRK